jgi:predicted RNase H-like nuclease
MERSGWGLDIGKGQWACVKLALDADDPITRIEGEALPYEPAPTISDDCVVAIADVPIGLIPDSQATDTNGGGRSGARPVDRGARRWVLHNGSVASPPTKEQYQSGLAEHARSAQAQSPADKRRKLGNITPAGLTQMGMEMIPAIASGAAMKAQNPNKIFESHPEVVFAVLAGEIVPGGKKTLSGTIGRALFLEERLGLDCLRWAMKQEFVSNVEVDDWLDALSMALVAYDWRRTENRLMLFGQNGLVTRWENQPDLLMAVPSTEIERLPERASADDFIDDVLASLRRRVERERL